MSILHSTNTRRISTNLLWAFAALTLSTCEEQGQFNPASPPERILIIGELTATPNRVSAGAQAVVSGRVIDQSSSPFPNLTVSLSAARGSIPTADTTDSNGRFSAPYTAPSEAGQDTVFIVAGGKSAFIAVTVVGASADLSIQATPVSALANGMDSVRVVATLVGRSGPLNRVPVKFETSAGGFNGQKTIFVNTDVDGRAIIQLTAPSSTATVIATVTASVELTQSPPPPSGFLRKRSAKPSVSDAETSTSVTFRGVSVTVAADPALIPGDGQARARIIARVKEDNDQAVPGARVNFSARLGSIAAVAQTDAAGLAAVDLTSASIPGAQDRVIARYGPVISDTVLVDYAPAVGRITLEGTPLSFLADGIRSTRLSAQVLGGTGQPAPGVEVSFAADGGRLQSGRAITGADGRATADLIAPVSKTDQLITIRASVREGTPPAAPRRPRATAAGTAESQISRPKAPDAVRVPRMRLAATLTDSISVLARGVQIRLSAVPDSIIARRDASAQIIAEVFETGTGNPVPNDTVRFATTLGSIPGSARLNAEGRAPVTLNAGVTAGAAVVTVRWGAGHSDSTVVAFLPTIGSLDVSADKSSLLAGGLDSARVTAIVRDALGGLASGVAVQYQFEHHPEVVHRLFTDAEGRAAFSVASPAAQADTAVRLTVNAGEISRPLRIGITAVTRLLSADPDSLSAGAPNPVQVTVQAFETSTRRPVAGDTVWFSAAGGVIQPFAVLDEQGVGRTSLRVGNQPGAAWVIAQLGTLKPDSLRLELVEPVARVAVQAGRGSIRADLVDTTLVAARVSNILDQPAADVWVTFEADTGEFSPPSLRTDADGLARAVFRPPASSSDITVRLTVTAHEPANRIQPPPIDAEQAVFSRRGPLRSNAALTDGIASGATESAGRIRREPPGWARMTPLDFDEVRDSLTIETRGVTLRLRAEPRRLRADGRSRSGVNVRLAETTSGTAIGGAVVRLGATLGALPAERITGQDGTFTDSLRAGIDTGVSRIRAQYGAGIFGEDSILFVPDPARLGLVLQLDPESAPAGSNQPVTARARVLDSDGRPAAGIAVTFTFEDPVTALVDAREYREVTRWENTFRVENLRAVRTVSLRCQLRGVDDPGTRIYLNRTPLNQVALPRDPLWGETSLILPTESLAEGVNRIEFIGAQAQGATDRFSIGGVRLGLTASALIDETTTDEDGWAQVQFRPDAADGYKTVRAALSEAPGRFSESDLRVLPGALAMIRISSATDTLLASGIEQTDVVALLTDASGNPIGGGVDVSFTAEPVGAFTPDRGRTLGDGSLIVRYNAPARDRNTEVTLAAGSGQVEGRWGLHLNGATLQLTSEAERALANGRAETGLRARLSTSDGRPVSGRRIEFTTTAGSVTPAAITDNSGVASATLIAANHPDSARVIARIGPEIRDTVLVVFAPLVNAVSLSAQPASIRADGLDSAVVTVSVSDGVGAPAVGVTVRLASDRGRLSAERVVTDNQGRAALRLFGVASREDDSIRVTASAADDRRDTLYIALRGISVRLHTEPDSLPANGVSTAALTASVFETSSHNPVTSGRVRFSATLGSVSAAADLDRDGEARATFTAPLDSGMASLTARYGSELSAADTVVLVDRAAAMNVTLSPESIRADGVTTAALEVRITDPWGGPAPQERVTLNFSGPGGVQPRLGYTDADGVLRAAVRGNALTADDRILLTAEARGGRFSTTVALPLRGVTMTLGAAPPLIAGDGRSTAAITARVRETTTGHAVSGDSVFFAAGAGVITRAAVLSEEGEAVAQLRSAAQPAIASVTANFGNRLTAATSVAFAGLFSSIELTPTLASLPADGVTQTALNAVVRDTLGRPVEGVSVRFRRLNALGALAADSAVTNRDGQAQVSFTSAALTTDSIAALSAAAGAFSDTAEAALRGITLEVEAAPDSLPANGVATAQVTARVRETTTGNPLIGRQVSFAVDRGAIAAGGTTDQNGVAQVTLTAPRVAGRGQITAAFGRTHNAFANVQFVSIVGALTVESERRTLLADGVSRTAITAVLVDQIGNPAPNVRVTFTAPDGGRLSPAAARTDNEGRANASLTSFAARADTALRVVAVADGGAAGQASVSLLGLTTALTIVPGQIPANGHAAAECRFSAYETTSHNPLQGQTVNFSADRGLVARSGVLDSLGRAAVAFTAPSEPGTATITAVLGDTLNSTAQIVCTASTPVHAAISVAPREVTVAGVGGQESAQINIDVTDEGRNVVPDGTRVIVRAAPDLGLTFPGGIDSAVVETRSGRGTVSVTAGNESGTVRFSVSFENRVLATGGELTVRSGPPSRIRVRPDPEVIYHPGGGLSAFPAAAIITDRYGNPVGDSTQVRFTLNPDTAGVVTAIGYTVGGVVYYDIQFPLDDTDYRRGIWVTYPNDHAGMTVYVRASAAGVIDSSRVILPGAVQGGEPARMEIAADHIELTADGADSTVLTVHLYDDDDQQVADMTEVRLRAELGNAQSPRFTSGGRVTSVYRAGRVIGRDTIRVTSGAVNDLIAIRLKPGPPASIVLTAEAAELRADGVQSTAVTALVRDRHNNPVEAGRAISFTTNLGQIPAQAFTNDQGVATARLTAGLITGAALVHAETGIVRAQTSVRFVSGDAANISLLSIDRRTIGVRGSGVPETATLTFEVRDDRGVPVDSLHRAALNFTLEGPEKVVNPDSSAADSVAVLRPASAQTNQDGRVTTTLNSGYFAGAVEVTASAGGGVFGEAIAIAIHGGPPDSSHFSILPLRCVTTGILGTAPDSVTILASLGDRFSNPVVPGTVVRFSSTGGVIQGSARTDSLGFCAVLLNTVRPWPAEGLDTVTAQTVDWRDQPISATATVIVSGPTRIAFDAADGWNIPFGGYRDFTITIADSFDHPLAPGTEIQFSVAAQTPRGENAEGVIIAGEGTTEPIEFGDCTLNTQFVVRVFNNQTGLDGAAVQVTAQVTSPNGNLTRSSSGRALGQVLSTTRSQVSLSRNQIPADGATAAVVTVTLYDTLGIAIAGVAPDAVVIAAAGGNATVTQPAAAADDAGRLFGSIVGNSVGAATVQVRVNGQLLDNQPQISFIPGPPARVNVTVLDRQLTVGGDTTTVSATVSDASGNAVSDATVVEFSAPDGSFNPTSRNTANGSAASLFISGIRAGAASLTVRASGGGVSAEATVDNLTFLPGAPQTIVVTAPNYNLQAGTQTVVTINAVDAFNNPVAANTELTMSLDPAGRGQIAPESVLTDAAGNAAATYTAGNVAGQSARVVATAGGTSGRSSPFTFAAGPPGRITLEAVPNPLTVGANCALSADVVDAFGNNVSDTTRVTFSLNPAVGTINPSSVTTQNGEANSTLTGVTAAGDVEVTATSGNTAASVRVTFRADVLAAVRVSAVPATVVLGRSSTITATATDRFGNRVAGEALNFAITTNPGGACTLQHNQRVSGDDGTAATIFTAGNTVGSAIITVTSDDDPDIEGSVFVDIAAQ